MPPLGELMPVTDVTETDKEIEITAELPGLGEGPTDQLR